MGIIHLLSCGKLRHGFSVHLSAKILFLYGMQKLTLKPFIKFFSLLLLFSCKSSADKTNLLDTGISRELAVYRKQQVSDVTYDLSFDIPTQRDQAIPAQLVLHLQIHSLDHPLYLDFNEQKDHLVSVAVNGKTIAIEHEKEHLIIPANELGIGENKLEISFTAGELSLNRNDDFLYTLLVPARASTLFPCFDQPDIKANYLLTITAPKEWKVLCGAPETAQVEKGDYVEHRFGKSDKMSTYLFSFVAGKFDAAIKKLGDLGMQFLYRETNTAKVNASVDTVFGLHRHAVDYLEKYTGHPFPFQKLDFAAIPIFQYGGMEHVGAIQYRESTLFLDSTATENQHLGRAKLIAHETSHMWFGDLVTMEWFNDVWMKEVFANFMADKIVNPAFPHINHDLQFMLGHYPSAYGEDRTRGTNPIRQELDNLKNAGSLYGAIIYNKAPIMMRQLERAIGKDRFQEGIREYIKVYAYSNAIWDNLIEILDAKTTLDLKKWSDVWVNQSGRPIFSDSIAYDDKKRIASFEIMQKAEDGSHKVWPQQFEIAFVYPGSTLVIPVTMVGEQLSLDAAKGLSKPEHILYNYNGLGYGVFPQEMSLHTTIPNIKDEVARGYSYINSYEKMLNGDISPLQALELYKNGLATEKNELIVRLIANKIETVFWHFLTSAQQQDQQKALEHLVYDQLQSTSSSNIKKTLFGLFGAVAYSQSGKERLYQVWSKEKTIPGLRLNEDDYTAMASQLALYQHDKADEILKAARAAISNPDKQKRFDFLLPSLAADEAVRDAFFQSFKEAKNREKEAWVLSALGNIHHPLRQESAIKHLELSLMLLEEIQRTGDIFFPKAWMSGTIGHYTAGEAYVILENFLSSHPDFSPSLRRKLLQATDNLHRAQHIKR